MNFVVGIAHLRDSYLITQGISAANALPSLFCWIIVVMNRGGFGILNPINNKISSANAKPLLKLINQAIFPK
jgi:hypothetical protein